MLLLAKKIILGYDVENIIASYCSAKTLCNLESLRKKNLSEIDSENVLEATWKVLVNKRWRLRGNILRAVGASSWKVAYQIMSFRHKIPRGIYTKKHNIVFGSCFSNGVESWISVNHMQNTNLRRSNIDGSDNNNNVIELRVCIQNICNGLISVPLDMNSFEMRCRSELDQTVQQQLTLKSVQNIGINGNRVEVSEIKSDVKLKPLDSVVLSVQIGCPMDMLFETDFLTRADNFAMKIIKCHPYSPYLEDRSITLNVKFVDEETVWDSYVELPGRVILLRQDCNPENNM